MTIVLGDLRMLSEGHISYEVGQMVDMYGRLPATRGTEWHNAVLEGFLLHARILLDFLYAKPVANRRESDVFAFQFVNGGEAKWETLAPRANAPSLFGQEVSDLFSKISTSLGHLSTERLDKVGWNYNVLYDGLIALVRTWVESLSRDARTALEEFERRKP